MRWDAFGGLLKKSPKPLKTSPKTVNNIAVLPY